MLFFFNFDALCSRQKPIFQKKIIAFFFGSPGLLLGLVAWTITFLTSSPKDLFYSVYIGLDNPLEGGFEI